MLIHILLYYFKYLYIFAKLFFSFSLTVYDFLELYPLRGSRTRELTELIH